MSIHETQISDQDRGQAAESDGQAYALLEQSRLCCAEFRATSGVPAEHFSLGRIHRQLGLAGWCAGAELDPGRRLPLLATAHRDATDPLRHPDRAHALAALMIEAEDAVVAALECHPSEHMQDARMHLLWAMELIAALV